jgi:transposase
MPLVRKIGSETQQLLKRLYQQSRHHRVRQRAHCLWLRSQGLKPSELRVIFPVSEKTLYNWFNAWDENGLVGLYDRPGRGRNAKLNDEQKAQVKRWVEASPRQLKGVIEKIQKTWHIKVSVSTLKRMLKAMQMSWRRMRRVPANQPLAAEYADKRAALGVLKNLDTLGAIDLYYLDETGFTLVPPIPYAWQTLGQTIGLPSQKSQRLNVLGFMHRQHGLESYVSTQSVTGEVVAACIEAFFPAVDKPTVIVMDQASVHVGQCVSEKRDEWAQRGLYLFELPTYSPELNLIEILWRFMKYEWINFSAYESWQSLTHHVEKMLVGFGKEFVINFA